MCIKGGISRLAQPEKTEFTHVNEYFEGKRNAEITVLDTSLPQHTQVCANFASKQDAKRANDRRSCALQLFSTSYFWRLSPRAKPQHTHVCEDFASKQDTKRAVLNGCKKKKTGLTGPISSRKYEVD